MQTGVISLRGVDPGRFTDICYELMKRGRGKGEDRTKQTGQKENNKQD